jgi:two-component system response regulator NreC
MKLIRIFIADDHVVVRHGIALLINAQPDMEVVGVAGDGRELAQQLRDCQTELVVMDISMPSMNGVDATVQVREQCPEIHVIVLSRHSEMAYVRQLMRVGARGYVLKQANTAELLAAIRAVMSGATYLDTSLSRQAVSRFVQTATRKDSPVPELSEREREVARLTAQGYSNKEIATQFGISAKTVDTYKTRALEKLGLQSRVALVRYALQEGWLEQP